MKVGRLLNVCRPVALSNHIHMVTIKYERWKKEGRRGSAPYRHDFIGIGWDLGSQEGVAGLMCCLV